MSPAQLARRLDRLADKLAPLRLPVVAHQGQPSAAVPLGAAVAALLHMVSGDVRARAAQERAGSTRGAP